MTDPKKKASGASIPEAQRHTTPIKLRLAPQVSDRLRVLAAKHKESLSEFVARLVLRAR